MQEEDCVLFEGPFHSAGSTSPHQVIARVQRPVDLDLMFAASWTVVLADFHFERGHFHLLLSRIETVLP